jgi:transcription antitermination factor NusG
VTKFNPEDFEGWYVVQTRFQAERLVVERLRDIGIDAWCPMETRLVRHARRTAAVERPLIPRHLFAEIRLKGDFYAIKMTMGVTGMIVRADKKPAMVNDEQLARLHLLEQLGEFDYTPKAVELVRGGDVRITAGWGEGRTATLTKFRGRERAELLLHALVPGGMRCVGVADLEQLEALDAA